MNILVSFALQQLVQFLNLYIQINKIIQDLEIIKQKMQDSKYHLNTIHIRPQQRMQQQPYQQLKAQLSKQNYFNPRYIQKNPSNNSSKAFNNNQQQLQDTISELKKLMIDQSSSDLSPLDKKKLAHIHSIKLHPMVNQNFISSFDQHQYKLQPQDKVKIVKQKVFRVQNYYNYLYQLKCKEQHQRKNKQIENYLKLAKQNNNRDSIIQTSSINNIQTNKFIKEKSIHQSNTNRQSKKRLQEERLSLHRQRQYQNQNQHYGKVLDPVYTKYEQSRRRQSQGYFLKQKDRKMVEQQSVIRGTSSNNNNRGYGYNNNNYDNDSYYDDSRW